MLRSIILFALISTIATSCQNGSTNNTEIENIISDSIKKHLPKQNSSAIASDKFANDAFRRDIISTLTNPKDLKKFDTLLLALDKQNVTFCQFIERLFKLDDSCYAIAKKLYPDPSQQKDFTKVHDKAIKEAESNYVKQFGINKSFSDFATVAYSFDRNIRSYCGEF